MPAHRAAIAAIATTVLALSGATIGLAPSAHADAPPTGAAWAAPAAPDDLVITPAPTSCHDDTRPGVASCFADVGAPMSDGAAAQQAQADAAAQAAPLTTLTKSAAYTPADLASLYGLPDAALTGDPTGSDAPVVGIVDVGYDPNIEAELSYYRAYFRLTDCTAANGCLSIIDQRGAPIDRARPQVAFDPGWHGEIALDVEAVSAVCPGCRIVLVAADSADITDLGQGVKAATAAGARYVSMSYGVDEFSGVAGFHPDYFSHTDNNGKPDVTYVAATGDDGYTPGIGGGVSYPAVAQRVIAAGGTSVSLVNGQWQQRAWSGSGSGCSTYVSQPTVQRTYAALTLTCANRALADVSALADANTGAMLYLAGQPDASGQPEDGWYLGGGTSLAAPLITAMYALAGNHTNATGVYANAASDATAFADITSGQTLHCISSSNRLCSAAPGWDGPTGLGTPRRLSAFAAAPASATTSGTTGSGTTTSGTSSGSAPTSGGATVTGSGGTTGGSTGDTTGGTGAPTPPISVAVDPPIDVPSPARSSDTPVTVYAGRAVRWSFAPATPGTYTYHASGLPAGLALSSGGVIAGIPTRSATGTITVTVTGTPYGASASVGTASFTYSVRLNRFTPSGPVRVAGKARAGRTVTAKAPVAAGVARARTTVTWYLNGRALTRHASSLRTRAAWRGKRLTFAVTVSAPYYDTAVYRSGNAVRIH